MKGRERRRLYEGERKISEVRRALELVESRNFEELAKEYDGIEVLMSEEDNLDLAIGEGLYWELYGWDCDSLLVFNKDIVEVLE